MNRLTAALVVGLGLQLHASEASAKWTRLSTPHFTFVGEVSESDLRSIAQRLEQFREVIGRLFSERTATSPVPTVVYVFANERSYAPFRTMQQGKPVDSSGYLSRDNDANVMALNLEQRERASIILFNQYTHVVRANALGDIPLWASVGLAEFYESFESRDGGRTAIIGLPSEDIRSLLQSSPAFIPIGQLIAADQSSPLYIDGNRRRAFDVESWTLVHYLSLGSPQRAGQLRTFLTAVGQGAGGVEAFAAAFGKDNAALETELRTYMRRLTLTGMRLDFDQKIIGAAGSPAQVISDAEAAGYLGDLLARIDRVDDARAYLKKATDGAGASPRAVAALGRLELAAGNHAIALPLLERATTENPDMPDALAWYGRALLRTPEGAGRPEATAKARVALARAYQLEPDNMATASELARAELTTRSGTARAVELLQKVVEATPGREDHKLLLAYALIEQGDHAAALNYLGPIVGRTKRADIKDEARKLLARAAAGSNAARRAADGTASPPAQNDSAPNTAAASSSAGAAPRETARIGFELRAVLAGETRALGVFSAVECRQGAIVLQIDTDSGTVKLAAANFDAIEFFTYRQEPPGQVPCGPQRPAFRALATFRTEAAPIPGSDTRNRAVAIELVPDGYVPR
jgi:tetratricopeptide (TPR) repeat protein